MSNIGKRECGMQLNNYIKNPSHPTDKDFRHLAPDYIDYRFIDQDYYRKQLKK